MNFKRIKIGALKESIGHGVYNLSIYFADVAEEFGEADVLFSLRSADSHETFHSPCAGKVLEVNNELEASPDLVTDDTYSEGWVLLIHPHDFDEDQLLTADEYIQTLSE